MNKYTQENNETKFITNIVYNVEEKLHLGIPGSQYHFYNSWIIWRNDNNNFIPTYRFSSIAGFWSLVNNIDLNKITSLVFMKEGISPNWEDKAHVNGGYCAVTINTYNPNFNDIFMTFLLALIGESLFDNDYDSSNITGITYINKPELKQFRFWLSNISKRFKIDDISSSIMMELKEYGEEIVIIYGIFDRIKKKHLTNTNGKNKEFKAFKKHHRHNKYHSCNKSKEYIVTNNIPGETDVPNTSHYGCQLSEISSTSNSVNVSNVFDVIQEIHSLPIMSVPHAPSYRPVIKSVQTKSLQNY